MKILKLEVESFGIFRRQEFQFHQGFQLICGPNEAGKSTLLQLIRETLFGFPHQTRYQLFDDEMAATATLALSGGRELMFRRRKGRKAPVQGELDDGSLVDETELARLLGANLQLFQSVFAFSLEELAAGQKSLEEAQLTEALYGGAIGGLANFQELQRRMQDEAGKLFSPRATKRPINALLQRAANLQQQLEQAAAQPADYRRLQQSHRELEGRINKLDQRVKQLRDVHHEAARMCSAWRPFQQLVRLRRQRTDAGELALSSAQWEEAKQLELARKQLEEAIRRQEQAIATRSSEQRELADQRRQEILAHQSHVQALQQETGRMHDFAEQLPALRRERHEVQQLLHDKLRNLDVSWSEQRLRQVPEDRQLNKRLLDAARDYNEKRRQLEEISKQEREFRRELTNVTRRLADDEPSDNDNAEVWDEDAQWSDPRQEDWDTAPTGATPTAKEEEAFDDRAPKQATRADEAGGTSEPTSRDAPRVGRPARAAPRSTAQALSEKVQDEASATDGSSPFAFLDALGDVPPDAASDSDEATGSTWETLDEIELDADAASRPADQSPLISEQLKQTLEELLAAEPADLKNRSRLETVAQQLDAAKLRVRSIESKMRDCGDAWSWDTAPADGGELASLRQRWQSLHTDRAGLADAVRELTETQASLLAADEAAAEHAPPDDETLRQLRCRRDEAWEILRRHFVQGQPQSEAARETFQCTPAQLADQFAGLAEAADQAADARQDQASLVAAIQTRRQAIRRNEQQRAQAEARLTKTDQSLRALAREWSEHWPDGPEPGADVAPWFSLQEERRGVAAEIVKWEQEAVERHEAAAAYETRLRQAMQAGDQPELDQLRTDVRERLRRHQRWLDQREQLRLDRDKLAAQHEEALRDKQRVANSVRQAELAWVDLRDKMRLPGSWEADAAAELLAEVNEAKADLQRTQRLQKQIQEMTSEVDVFRSRVQRIAGDDSADRSAVEQVNQLAQRLAEAQESQQKLSASRAEDQRLRDELRRLRAEQDAAEQRWRKLCQRSGAASDDAFVAALDGASVHQQLQSAEAQVHAALACEDPARRATLMAELERASEHQLRERLDDAGRHLQELESERDLVHKDAGAVRERLQQTDGSDAAAMIEMQRQSTLAELSESVDRWAPLVLGSRLMDLALQRFEQKHQPALLHDVARMFRHMTGGAYVEVKRQLGQNKSLVVVSESGKLKTPQQLSTGAREQLYLAIRMAYVRKYCSGAEPLPLVMDDVLVNFDDLRAKQTIEALIELSEEVQVLMMTCHRRTARFVHEQLPDRKPVLLSSDPDDSWEDWVAEASPSARRSRVRRRRPDRSTSPGDGPTQGQLFS